MLDQVNFEKNPALTDFGAGYLAGTRLLLQRDRVNLQEGGSLLQGEGIHGLTPGTSPASSIILATPNKPDLPGDMLQIIEHEMNYILPIRLR
jgi:hypothetical protein